MRGSCDASARRRRTYGYHSATGVKNSHPSDPAHGLTRTTSQRCPSGAHVGRLHQHPHRCFHQPHRRQATQQRAKIPIPREAASHTASSNTRRLSAQQPRRGGERLPNKQQGGAEISFGHQGGRRRFRQSSSTSSFVNEMPCPRDVLCLGFGNVWLHA